MPIATRSDKCSIHGCKARPRHTRRDGVLGVVCRTHYRLWVATGSYRKPPKPRRSTVICSIPPCENKATHPRRDGHEGRVCPTHYKRWAKEGSYAPTLVPATHTFQYTRAQMASAVEFRRRFRAAAAAEGMANNATLDDFIVAQRARGAAAVLALFSGRDEARMWTPDLAEAAAVLKQIMDRGLHCERNHHDQLESDARQSDGSEAEGGSGSARSAA